MSAIFIVRTFFEIIAVCLLIWGFINEKKVVAFENKLARAIAINIRNHRRRKLAEQKRGMEFCKQPAEAVYTPVKPPEPAKKLPGRVA